jgi:hypothetical protein
MAYQRTGLGDLTSSLANAIAQFEGYNVPNSVAQRNNNPGNLRSGPGQIGTDSNGYAIFPDAQTGFAALDNQVNLNISRGLTLQQFIGGGNGYPGYAPSADNNNVSNYVNFLSGQLGIDPNTPLSGVSPGSFRVVPPHQPPRAERTKPGGSTSPVLPTLSTSPELAEDSLPEPGSASELD